nr:restriction endonuclease subunit S [uncultured Alistipes sp.]
MRRQKTYRLCEIVQFNPTERLAKGTIAKKVAMENLHPFTRAISGYELAAYSGGSKFRNGDTLMARITPCLENGKTAYVSILDDEEVGFGSTEYIVFRNFEGVTDRKFIYYFVSNPWFRNIAIKSMVGSSGRQRVQQSVLENLEINLPPLAEQKRIAAILGALDDKIELNRRINANLEEQAKALFKSWFVDFEPFKDAGFVDSELGPIPVGWRVGDFTEIVAIKGGGTPKTDVAEYWGGIIPFFTPKDVSDSCYVLKTEKYITDCGLDHCSSALYKKGTVFITARGTVGKIVMAGCNMAMNQTNYALLGKEGINQLFVYNLTIKLADRLLKKSNGAVFNAITVRDFESEKIIIPQHDVLLNFGSVVAPIYAMILHHNNQMENLISLRDTLLPKLMSRGINME